MKRLRMWWLKRKARRAYERYLALLDRLDCGKELAWFISPALRRAVSRFNGAMDDLEQIDPGTPRTRL